jgi:predicted dehydrogenase
LVAIRLGVLGLGSVFWTPYRSLISRLVEQGRVELVAGYDPDPEKREALARLGTADADVGSATELIERDDVDVVVVLTSMNEHGSLAQAALRAGKHVLVEKPMATSLEEAAALVELSRSAPGLLVCAPHIVLSPTYREMHRRVRDGVIGRLVLARARYGWSGPWWARWFYEEGGGALFDLGVYNLTSLCGFFGPVRRVTALVGTAIPERVVEGELMQVRAEDNAHVALDFGDSRFASIMTGFTMQKYRSPAIELYGTDGVLQMLGDDWAPEGFEQWRNAAGVWEIFPESDPHWPWTDGLRHLVECIENGTPTVTRPEHAYHALEVMLAAMRSSREGRAIEIESGFPAIDYGVLAETEGDHRRVHDPRTVL